MSGVATAILDAAERRMRIGGFSGFSHREIAAEVGMKSSSVHYHFPTKDNLAAAVIRRYIDHFSDLIDRRLETEPDLIKVWTDTFRGTVDAEKRICPCVVLGAGTLDLPPEVAAEVSRFFAMCISKLTKAGLSPNSAAELLSTLTGAMIVSNALHDASLFERATGELLDETGSKASVAKAESHLRELLAV